MAPNKQLIFSAVPVGMPVPGKDLRVETRDFDLEQAPPAGGIITKNLYASFDPYQRGRMRDQSVKSYVPSFTIGQPINNGTVAKVLKSDCPQFKAGDLVVGHLPTEEYSAVPAPFMPTVAKIENPYNLDPVVFLGAMGMPGNTAYSSLLEIGKPVSGEVIFISSAVGAVGQIVGQLAKRLGLHVIGSVGSDEKLDFMVKELGFEGFNYKTENPADALKRLAPKGIDIYYDNVGGSQLDAALAAMNDFGRIIACGMISEYNKTESERYGVKNIIFVVSKRLTMRGFVVSDKNMGPVYKKERDEKVGKWLHEGSIKEKTHITDGIDNGPEGFVGMLQGKNFGKAVLKIANLEE